MRSGCIKLLVPSRPDRDQVLMQHAQVAAVRGTCSRAQVGVVIAVNARILVTGYNGAPKHMPHCDHSCDCGPGYLENKHLETCRSQQPCEIAVHAESNAIAYAARYGIALKDAAMYTTHMPCLKCAQLIINAGLDRVVYDVAYRDLAGLELLSRAGIVVDRIN